jgi:hypothetical protein
MEVVFATPGGDLGLPVQVATPGLSLHRRQGSPGSLGYELRFWSAGGK